MLIAQPAPLGSVLVLAAAMALLAGVEAVAPLRARGRWHRAHVAPNLTLSGIAVATSALLDGALVVALARARARGLGLLPWLAPSPALHLAVVVVALDFAFYASHVAMHAVPGLWRFHRVHHADPAVDVTTTIRQHPGESVFRSLCLAPLALALGASPTAFAAYRLTAAVQGLLEHANVRAPLCLEVWISWLAVTPGMHQVHHARVHRYTDTNYGNLLSLFDRLFRTFTPPAVGRRVDLGLDGLDDPETQTLRGLLALPFRGRGAASVVCSPEAPSTTCR